MKTEAVKREILGFVYAERLKSALLAVGQLLDVLDGLDDVKRPGGLELFAAFVSTVGREMRLAANVMETQDWHGLVADLNLMEGYVHLRQMELARQELSRTLSRVTTLSGRAMTALKDYGLL